jgi:hypothetical protein
VRKIQFEISIFTHPLTDFLLDFPGYIHDHMKQIMLLGSICQFQAYFPCKYYAFKNIKERVYYFERSTHLRHTGATRKIQFDISIFTHPLTDSL